MGIAKSYANQLNWDKSEIDQLISNMMSGDYEHLIEVFDDAFGDFIIIER